MVDLPLRRSVASSLRRFLPIETANRYARAVAFASVIAIVAAVALLATVLPADRGLEWIEAWTGRLGPWGPAAYALIYAGAVVLLIPGSVLTLAAGAPFGLTWGMVAASAGSTLGAAIAFLIARHGGRAQVATMIKRYPTFDAIDTAISEGGWRIVGLLRLTPIVPFNLSNYLFGLTAVGFRPYVLASWLFMLPGAFMYTYLGYLGGEGLQTAAGRESGGGLVWTARGVGLVATVALIVYVTRHARRALARHHVAPTNGATMDEQTTTMTAPTEARGWPWRATGLLVLAAVLLGAAGWAFVKRDAIRSRFGPPQVAMVEAYADEPDVTATSPAFDHTAFDALLAAHVDEQGGVDYEGLARDVARLDAYLAALATAPFDAMSRDEKLALLINAYNAFTLRLILDHAPVKSIKEIPAAKRWDHKRWQVAGNTWSLNEIEHEQIRPRFNEPRIHFALVCAAIGCPKLRNEAYTAARLEAQLEDQTRDAHENGRWFRFDPDRGVVSLTRLYDWYGGDFTQSAGSVLAFAARYSPQLQAALDAGRTPKIQWLEYDWGLNLVTVTEK